MPFRASHSFGRVKPPPVVALKMASASDYYRGGGTKWGDTTKRVIIRYILDQSPTDGTGCVAGVNSLSGGPWALIRESTGFGRGRVTSFEATYDDLYLHIPTDNEIGMYITDEIVLDTVAGRITLWRNGRRIGLGVASVATSLGDVVNPLGINTRATADGTFGYGAMSIVEVQTSSTTPTSAEIIANATRLPGTVVSGSIKLLVASSLGSPGATPGTWTDSAASLTLTKHGSPTLIAVNQSPVLGIGTGEVYGDSIAAGRDDIGGAGRQGNGWRKSFITTVIAGGRAFALTGQFVGGNNVTGDFDFRHTAQGGQALGIANGGIASRLSTLASDLALSVGDDGATILAFGANDIPLRVTAGETAQQASDHFIADINTAVGLIKAARSGPIVIVNILRQATSAASATARAGIDIANAALPATIAALRAGGANIVLADVCTAVTPDQATADNTSVLYDGVHESAPSYATSGITIGTALLSIV